jgi:hypothetical protein
MCLWHEFPDIAWNRCSCLSFTDTFFYKDIIWITLSLHTTPKHNSSLILLSATTGHSDWVSVRFPGPGKVFNMKLQWQPDRLHQLLLWRSLRTIPKCLHIAPCHPRDWQGAMETEMKWSRIQCGFSVVQIRKGFKGNLHHQYKKYDIISWKTLNVGTDCVFSYGCKCWQSSFPAKEGF